MSKPQPHSNNLGLTEDEKEALLELIQLEALGVKLPPEQDALLNRLLSKIPDPTKTED